MGKISIDLSYPLNEPKKTLKILSLIKVQDSKTLKTYYRLKLQNNNIVHYSNNHHLGYKN